MIAVGRLADDALVSAALHVVGQTRAFVHQLAGARREITALNDPRAAAVVEAIDLAMREPAGPGTLRHVEQVASVLLRSLCRAEA